MPVAPALLREVIVGANSWQDAVSSTGWAHDPMFFVFLACLGFVLWFIDRNSERLGDALFAGFMSFGFCAAPVFAALLAVGLAPIYSAIAAAGALACGSWYLLCRL